MTLSGDLTPACPCDPNECRAALRGAPSDCQWSGIDTSAPWQPIAGCVCGHIGRDHIPGISEADPPQCRVCNCLCYEFATGTDITVSRNITPTDLQTVHRYQLDRPTDEVGEV